MDSIKKIGRPKSENPRGNRVTVFFADDEFKEVSEAATREIAGISEFIRRLVIIKIRGF